MVILLETWQRKEDILKQRILTGNSFLDTHLLTLLSQWFRTKKQNRGMRSTCHQRPTYTWLTCTLSRTVNPLPPKEVGTIVAEKLPFIMLSRTGPPLVITVPQNLGWYMVHCNRSIHTCWMNKWMGESCISVISIHLSSSAQCNKCSLSSVVCLKTPGISSA